MGDFDLTCPECGFTASVARSAVEALGKEGAAVLSEVERARRTRRALLVVLCGVDDRGRPVEGPAPLLAGVVARAAQAFLRDLPDGKLLASGEAMMGILLAPGRVV